MRTRSGYGLAMSLVLTVVLAVPAWGVTFAVTGLATSGSIQESDPETAGQWIAYRTATPFNASSGDIVLRDLSDGSSTTIGAGDGFSQSAPDVSAGRVAYQDSSAGNADVRVYDSVTGLDFAVASSADDEVSPRISGNMVVWYNDTDDELWYRDLYYGVANRVTDADNVTVFDVDNGFIVWAEAFVEEYVYYMAPGAIPTRLLYEVPPTESVEHLRIHGTTVAATMTGAGADHVARWRIPTGERLAWFEESSRPDVFHDTYVYEVDDGQTDIKWFRDAFGEPAGDTVAVFGSASFDEGDASIFGRRVVFERYASLSNVDLYVAESAIEIDRNEGEDRYRTAVSVSQEYFDTANSAVLCTGLNFPDALSAGPLAAAMHGPLLLTRPDAVPDFVMDELERLDPMNVTVVGGSDVVSDDVLEQLSDAGFMAYRIAGDDRYETSVAIARFMDEELLNGVWDLDMAFFARGDDFPDALAVGPVAAGARSPIILTRSAEVPAAVADAIGDLGITSGFIAGGADVVTDDVKAELRDLMIEAGGDDTDPMIVQRWAGADRYATAIEIVEGGLEHRWIDLDAVGVATGFNFPDALGGGAALASYGSPLVLVRDTSVPPAVAEWVAASRHGIGRMDIFGGVDVVSESVSAALRSALQE